VVLCGVDRGDPRLTEKSILERSAIRTEPHVHWLYDTKYNFFVNLLQSSINLSEVYEVKYRESHVFLFPAKVNKNSSEVVRVLL